MTPKKKKKSWQEETIELGDKEVLFISVVSIIIFSFIYFLIWLGKNFR